MFIVCHHNDVICKHRLLFPVIIRVISCRYIIVHRQHQIIIFTLDGQLPDELQISVRRLCRKQFEIQIDAIQIVFDGLRHQIVDQIISAGCHAEYTGIIHILVFQIADQSPDFHALLMTVVYIILAAQRHDAAIVVIQIKPGWREHIYALCLAKHRCHICIRCLRRHLMPCHIDP